MVLRLHVDQPPLETSCSFLEFEPIVKLSSSAEFDEGHPEAARAASFAQGTWKGLISCFLFNFEGILDERVHDEHDSLGDTLFRSSFLPLPCAF